MNKTKILCVIDMQNDFIDGVLGTKEAVAIVDNVVEKINNYKERSEWIIATQDTHYSDYLETLEGKNLPIVHCLANSHGWQLNNRVFSALKNYSNKVILTKNIFGSKKLINFLKTIIDEKNYDEFEIELVGLVLDICVVSNALLLKTNFPNTKIVIDASCTAGTSKEKFEKAKVVLKSCQVDVYE